MTLGDGIDGTVRRIARGYDARGLMFWVSSHDDPQVGSGSVLNEVKFSHNAFNQLIEDIQSHAGAADGSTPRVGYAYADGSANTTRRTSITYPCGKAVNIGYGASGSLADRLGLMSQTGISGESEPLALFSWAGAGRFLRMELPQPDIELSYMKAAGEPVGDAGDDYTGYDRFGRTVDMRWFKTTGGQYLDRIQYGYDRASRRLWRQDLAAPASALQDKFYGYDGLGQVISAQQGNLNINRTAIGGVPAEGESFQYDPIGNWRHYQRKEDGLSVLDQPRENNTDNQIVSLDHLSAGIGYDASGNMTATRPDKEADWSKGYLMVWDAWNRLVEVKEAQTETSVARYAYDGLARRVTREVEGVVHHDFYNDAWKQVEERLDAAATPASLYYWSLRKGHRDELLRRDRDTNGSGDLDESLYCVMDYYDPIAITDDAGGVVERYDYSAFGLVQIQDAEFEPRAGSEFAWNFLFHGQFRDAETGWDNYGYRYYLPELGRWASRDPIEEGGGVNLYCMSKDGPINRVDYYGLLVIPDQPRRPEGSDVWPPPDYGDPKAPDYPQPYQGDDVPMQFDACLLISCKNPCKGCCAGVYSIAKALVIAKIASRIQFCTSLTNPLAVSICSLAVTAWSVALMVRLGIGLSECLSECDKKP